MRLDAWRVVVLLGWLLGCMFFGGNPKEELQEFSEKEEENLKGYSFSSRP